MRVSSVGRSIALASVIIIFGVPLSLTLVYVDYDLLSVSYGLAFERVNAWPWFRGAAALATICCLWPFQALWFSRGDKSQYDDAVAAWAALISWFAVLFMYPGTRRLGLWSDSGGIWAMTLLVVVQDTGLLIVARSLWRAHEASRQAITESPMRWPSRE